MVTLNNRRAVYTGVFDPVHRGHLEVIGRASRIYEQLIVGVGTNPDKNSFFSGAERVEMLKSVTCDFTNVIVQSFSGLAVRFVRDMDAGIMIRGLRTPSDMEYEFTMSLMNANLDPGIETLFLMAKPEFAHVSGSLLRQIALLDGDLSQFLPPQIQELLKQRAQLRLAVKGNNPTASG